VSGITQDARHRAEDHLLDTEIESKMKKTLRILTVLSLVASSILFATPSHAATFVCGSSGTYTVTDGVLTDASNCSGTITIDSSVHTIGDHAFSLASSGSSYHIVVPDTVLVIDYHAFVHDELYLLSVTLPASLSLDMSRSAFEFFYTNAIFYCGSNNSVLASIARTRATISCPITIPSAPTIAISTAPTSIVATATGKLSATVSFAAPASNGGSAVTSYTATSTPGGITQTLTQATGGTFNFDGLQPGTAYTFAVTATNAIGTSAAATSNSITTTPLVVASLSALSFADDGTGTGGKIVWSGTSIDAVLYTGSSAYYPGPYNYGAFSSGWNGRIRNLTPGTEYTVSLFVVSADGVGESKSLTFKTSATLPAPAGAASATISRADEMTAQLPKLFAWIDENTFVEGEGNRMKMMLNKFDALVTSPHRSHIKVPTSRVLSVVATSLTPLACSVVSATAKEHAGLVKALSGDTCTISYTVSGGSRAPATMVKDFVFKKFAQ
jgi:hypothetical protein